MRDVAVLLIVAVGLGFTLRSTHYGVLLWSWLGYMNPHRLTWGFAYSFPFAQIVGIFTLVMLLFSKDDKRFPVTATTVVWILLMLWMCLSTVFAWHQEAATEQLIKIMKIQLFVFITMMLFKTRERIDQLIWIIVISIGYFGVKGGIFTVRTGGGFRVWGPPGSFIADNNELAAALLMILPLSFYLYRHAVSKWVKWGLISSSLFILVSIFGSQSRGAFIGISGVAFYFWWQSKHKILIGFAGILVAALIFGFMPDSWYERMGTIQNYQEDESAMGRINAWTLAIKVANDSITGGGLNVWTQQVYDWYLPGAKSLVAHSIYFSMLGEHGWIGLVLFVSILILSWRSSGVLIKQYKHDLEYGWIADLAKMIRISLLAYMTSGAFLSLSYFDLSWHLFAVLVVLRKYIHEPLLKARAQPT